LTCTLSAARKNPPELNSGAVTASALGCTSPAWARAASLLASLNPITSGIRPSRRPARSVQHLMPPARLIAWNHV
jgi:hypothetical protein